MKQNSTIIIIFLLLFTLSEEGLSQCNVDYDRTEGLTFLTSARETIFKTDDFENGFLTAGVSMVSFFNDRVKDNPEIQFGVLVFVGAYGQYEMIKPRRLTINFINAPKIRLEAQTMEKLYLGGNSDILQSFFLFSEEHILLIAKNEINNIVIWDNRTEETLSCKPYKFILKEQLECIFKRIPD